MQNAADAAALAGARAICAKDADPVEKAQLYPTQNGAQLDLTKGANNIVVGKVTETCNDPDGYSITFTSQGGGKLTSNGASVPYTASYDNVNQQSLGSQMRLSRNNAAFGVVKDLKVSVDSGSNRVAGSYSDTITVTIAAN